MASINLVRRVWLVVGLLLLLCQAAEVPGGTPPPPPASLSKDIFAQITRALSAASQHRLGTDKMKPAVTASVLLLLLLACKTAIAVGQNSSARECDRDVSRQARQILKQVRAVCCGCVIKVVSFCNRHLRIFCYL